MVIFGSAFVLKFVILASLSSPAGGRFQRVLQVLLEGVTLGTLTQEVLHPAAGYVAFAVLLLYLGGVAALPESTRRSLERPLPARIPGDFERPSGLLEGRNAGNEPNP